MPSQKTLCQACGELIPTVQMPDHVWKVHGRGVPTIGDDGILRPSGVMSEPLDVGPIGSEERGIDFVASFERITGKHVSAPPPAALADLHDHTRYMWLSDVPPVQQASEFAGPYAERGDAIAELLDAVSSGATVEIQGPSLTRATVRCWVESAAGSRHAEAEGDAIGPVLVDVARKWKETAR